MHAQLDASTIAPSGDAEQLDAVAELLGIADVGRRSLLVMPSTWALSNCTGIPKAIALMMVALCAASTPSMSKVGSASA